ncbi:MAG: helix-turn-helix domain-containing protein [Ruminococcus sp.]|nr:helix-turn-helix domain-containing protein [Ruminococcus sp.]MCM1381717.1 helix-turn-helix domain-containing protein [Muribaculaceae bacterium]MCM1479596.1 helix-turn-helix domain-containing protein [Muribaculaceae bacterium]
MTVQEKNLQKIHERRRRENGSIMVDIMFEFGNRLSDLRKQNHMTQQVLSERLCVTKATVSAYETGMRLPSYDVLIKIAYIFHVSTDYLLGVSDKNHLSVDGLTDGQIQILTLLISEFKITAR